ncbi:hypothetical protein BQ8482_380170 [Mesorhizobium delmotii]|uniref:Uncharacterized protein n=1 Tax=Mesorhizobium delmotii TaxID=1631247 RepID=A0A2P9ASB5_9HYPH|nr:hypothetical protein BQ8482_380170 [Mesorhizobium delmotii]
MVRPFKWIAAKVLEASGRDPRRQSHLRWRVSKRTRLVPASSVPSFFWHRVKKRDGLLMEVYKASAVPI